MGSDECVRGSRLKAATARGLYGFSGQVGVAGSSQVMPMHLSYCTGIRTAVVGFRANVKRTATVRVPAAHAGGARSLRLVDRRVLGPAGQVAPSRQRTGLRPEPTRTRLASVAPLPRLAGIARGAARFHALLGGRCVGMLSQPRAVRVAEIEREAAAAALGEQHDGASGRAWRECEDGQRDGDEHRVDPF
eukprot:3357644-Prymnesium_polylepis.1